MVETSAIIDYLRGKKEAVEGLENLEGEICGSFVCLGELYEGIVRSKDKGKAESAVKMFFSGLSLVYGLDEETAENFGKIRADLRQRGRVIEDLDILIAATCKAHDLILITQDIKHFSMVKDLKIYKILKEG